MPRSQSSRLSRSASARSSNRFTRTEIIINVYDLLPPSKLSTVLWPLGLSLLHTGVVLDDREYSYGATPASPDGSSAQTGVFWTRPRLEPPGGTFRCSLLQGITYMSREEIQTLVRDVSARFPGSAYNLLSNNCNHFTNHMIRALTQREAPAWINRASRVGTMLPCLVPSAWIDPPEADFIVSPDGSEADTDENSRMTQSGKPQGRPSTEARRESLKDRNASGRPSVDSGRPSVEIRDTSGRALPSSELAPADRLV